MYTTTFFLSFFLSQSDLFYLLTVGVEVSCCTWSHTWTHTHSVGLLWTRDGPVAEASIWQHTTHTRDRQPCPRRDSNPQSQQASGLSPRGHRDRPRLCNSNFKGKQMRHVATSGKVFFDHFDFPPSIIIPPILHIFKLWGRRWAGTAQSV